MEANRQATSQIAPSNLEEQPESSEDSGRSGEQYLQFRLYPDTTALLPIEYLAEIATVRYSAVIPVPGMPAWVSGIYNWRGDILWIVDLGFLLGLPSWQEQPTVTDTHAVMILRSVENTGTGPLNIGAIVQRVEDIYFYDSEAIEPVVDTDNVSSKMALFQKGIFPESQGNQPLAVLCGDTIFKHISQEAST